MLLFSNRRFKISVQNIYLKVCIAVAISIIRSKPTNLSLNEYVENIQNACLREWQNVSIGRCKETSSEECDFPPKNYNVSFTLWEVSLRILASI